MSAPRMELDIGFNEKLNLLPCCMVRREVKSTVAVDHEIEIGTNQSEKLARAMRESVARKEGGSVRRRKTAATAPAAPTAKSATNAVSAVLEK